MTYLYIASKRIKYKLYKPLEVWYKILLDKMIENPKVNYYELLKGVS